MVQSVIPSIRPRATAATVRSRVGETVIRRIGTVKAWELENDGSSLLKADYPELFAEFGYTYGGSGLSFNLPDDRGRAIRAWAHGQSTDPDRATRTDRGDGTDGDAVGTLQSFALQTHTHTVPYGGGGGATQGIDDPVTDSTSTITTGAVSGATTSANETRMINIGVMLCTIFED